MLVLLTTKEVSNGANHDCCVVAHRSHLTVLACAKLA